MPAIKYVEESQAAGAAKEAYAQIKGQFRVSKIPNTFKVMANKPEFLKALLAMDDAVFKDDKLDSKTKHLIAVAVSAASGCQYCLHAHSAIAQLLGATNEEVAEAVTVAAVMGAYNNVNKAMGMQNDIVPKKR